MLSGVSKSGSPADNEMMSRPAALSCRAFIDAAMVAEGWMRFKLSAMKPIGQNLSEDRSPRASGADTIRSER